MDECIDSLCETKVFSTLNCNAGYWQVLIADGAREKTAFVCHKGADHYKCMPFGLTNAPATSSGRWTSSGSASSGRAAWCTSTT